jgi:hypothetical protein
MGPRHFRTYVHELHSPGLLSLPIQNGVAKETDTMTSTNHDELNATPAENYCEHLVLEVNRLEQLISRSIEYGDICDDENRGEICELWNELAAVAGCEPETYSPSFTDYCTTFGLDVLTLGERRNSGFAWRISGGRLLLTDGGPSAWIEWQVGSEWVQIHVRWPSCNANEFVHAPYIAKGFADETSW